MSPFSAFVAKQLLDKIVSDRAAQALAFSEILGQFPEQVVAPDVPAYAKVVSAYGYKPRLGPKGTLDMLRKANRSKLWRFAEFSYGHLKDDVFWNKSTDYYPFCPAIRPRLIAGYPGYDKYMEGRIGLSVPTVEAEYWDATEKSRWTDALRQAFA
jgi:hypothetical protein